MSEKAINLVAFARERVAPVLAEIPAHEDTPEAEAVAKLANLIVCGVLARVLPPESIEQAFELARSVLAYYGQDAREHGATGQVH